MGGERASPICCCDRRASSTSRVGGPVGYQARPDRRRYGHRDGDRLLLRAIDEGQLPKRLIQLGARPPRRCSSSGLLAAADHRYVDATIGDRALNYAFIAATLCIAVSLVIATGRRSRTVWFLLGWSPPLIVFGVRATSARSRNPDIIDMLTSRRSRSRRSRCWRSPIAALARERDAARLSRTRRAATTDLLTGLSNRAAFQDWLARLHGDLDADLVVVDDHLRDQRHRGP